MLNRLVDHCWEGAKLQQFFELIHSETGTFKNGAQRAGFHRFRTMDRNNRTAGYIGCMAEHHMRSVLAQDNKASSLQDGDESRAGDLRQSAQAVTLTSVKMARSEGNGNPSSFRLRR